jgi:feruloyl esterase
MLAAGMLVATAAVAAAQNGYSFLDAGSSAVDYRQAPAQAQASCNDLRRLASSSFIVLSAEQLGGTDMPAFCRVVGMIPPEVRFEVALPLRWNRRLYMRGNGGFAGEALEAPARVAQRDAAIRNGFVAVQTNTGHDATAEPLASFAFNNVQKEIDYAFRAVHATIAAAKTITERFYDRPPAFSYWDGCSTGGRQGLMSMQRFPGDFDGVVVGAPVLNFVDTMVWGVWNARALAQHPIGLDKMPALAAAIYGRCDAADGVADGLIDDPRRCGFDPAADLPKCTGGETAQCFTAGEIETLKAIYGGVVSGGKPYFPGQPVGAEKAGTPPSGGTAPESGWAGWLLAGAGANRQITYGESFLRYMAFPRDDPTYDWRSFDMDKDVARMEPVRSVLNAGNPDLAEFRKRGGKAIMYFGWADTALNPLMGIDYYMRVTDRFKDQTAGFFRLFMVPGMFHCRGGIGVDRIDALTPLVNWVENGVAPDRIVGSRVEGGRIVRTRPLCPFPQVAKYSGSGSIDDAASFRCALP